MFLFGPYTKLIINLNEEGEYDYLNIINNCTNFMQVRTGIDIIEVKRIEDAINNLGESFLKRVYTEYEIEYCNSKNNMKYQHFAARFAAKEAVFKAISSTLKSKYDITWTDIEIKNDENGRPEFRINKLDGVNIISKDISMSHLKKYAVASVTIVLSRTG